MLNGTGGSSPSPIAQNERIFDMSTHCKDKCIVCGKYLQYGHKTDYCLSCFKKKQNDDKLKLWLESGDTGCSVQTTLRNCIRDYILEKQEHKCAICGISDVWNGKPLNFVLDHIDGDASNDKEYNLRLICHNCDSQLPTYKSRNKNSKRKHRLVHRKTVRAVNKIDLETGSVLKTYESVKQAALDVGIQPHSIRNVIGGHKKSACGFGWKYAD